MLGDRYITLDRNGELVEGLDVWRDVLADPQADVSAGRWLLAVEEGCRTAIRQRLTTAAATRKPFGVEGRLRRANGEICRIAFRFVPQQLEAGWLGIVSDIDAAGRPGNEKEMPAVVRTESDIDAILADSFPASDPPPWTLGSRRRLLP